MTNAFSRSLVALFTFALVAMAAMPAAAYVGPGAGLAAIGTVVALVAAVFLAIVGFLWYPIKRMRQARREKNKTTAAE